MEIKLRIFYVKLEEKGSKTETEAGDSDGMPK